MTTCQSHTNHTSATTYCWTSPKCLLFTRDSM